ncbi:MAG: acetate--CoA ligase family protein [Candidatus Aenigmarchaeota archaeon]|nr:acetate--CoA ligase family protein [Candidatus Aenigmarchaeota archaeon]
MAAKIPDHKAYKMLEKFRIPVVRHTLAKSFDDVAAFAKHSGYPVVLKIDSPGVIHKRKAGCMDIVYEERHLKRSYDKIISNAKTITHDIDGVIAQEFVHGQEVIIGMRNDVQFGHVIMFGTGGVLAESTHDVSFRLIPLDRRDAEEMIKDTKIYTVLNQMKPLMKKIEVSSLAIRTPFSENFVEKTADIILKVAKIATKHPKLSEMDINPLMVHETGVAAADVRMIVSN